MKNYFFALWLFALAATTHATVLTLESRQTNLLPSAQFLEDPSGTLSFEDVRGMGERFHSWTRGGSEMNFGLTSSAYWFRIPVQRLDSASSDWLLVLEFAKLAQLDFYPPNGPAIHTGSTKSFSTRPYFDRFFVFPLTVTTQEEHLYIRATSRYSLTVPMTMWQPDAYREGQQRFQLMQFMYYGALVVLAMYGLVIYLALRDTRFLIYCAYIVTTGIGVFASNGFGRQLVWPDAAVFDEIAPSGFLALAAVFVVSFARKLLLLPGDRTWVSRGMQLSQSLFLAIVLLILLQIVFPVVLRPANQLLMLNSLSMGVLISIACVRAYFQKREGLRFFLAGWIALWFGISIASLRMFGWISSNGLTSYALQLSTIVEMLLMALALGDLLRIEHLAHKETQRQALATNQELLQITQASEENLKKAIQERTAQLEVSLKIEKNLREQYVRFGSMISHEFRTPLSIIQSQASLMRKEHERGLDQIPKRLEAIGSATKRLTVMFEKWLNSDAITQTMEVLEPKTIELRPWLSTLIKTSSHLLLEHAVNLDFNPHVTDVQADEYHLGIAVTNLIDNAAKYAPVDTPITIQTLHKEGFVGIAVSDKGPGVPLDIQDKVFVEFFRLAPENSIRGVGLGLSIVERIAHAHGGHVKLFSVPGQGATFYIWLPADFRKDHK
jgi:signal transduction histidine kinase